jgi:hypothetical protein
MKQKLKTKSSAYLIHYEPLIIEKWAFRLLKADKNRTFISTEPIARIDVEWLWLQWGVTFSQVVWLIGC